MKKLFKKLNLSKYSIADFLGMGALCFVIIAVFLVLGNDGGENQSIFHTFARGVFVGISGVTILIIFGVITLALYELFKLLRKNNND